LRCCRQQLLESKRRQGNIKDDRVVDGESKHNSNQEKLLSGFEAVRIEIAMLRVLVIDKQPWVRY
jgi:hypothetical protein